MKNKTRKYLFIFLIPFIIWIICFEILPFMTVIISSFKNADGGFSLFQYKTALTNKFYTQGIMNSIKISFYSSLVGIIVAIVCSYSISRLPSKVRDKVLILSNMTSNFAGVPLAFAFMILLGNNGVMTILGNKLGIDFLSKFNLYSPMGLVIVYIYFQIPLGILLMYPAYDGIKSEWEEAAKLLGASKLNFWRFIVIPVILPSVLGTFSILFANAIGAYATVLALTSGNLNMLSIRIGSLISGDMFLNPELASALAVILAVVIVFTNLINTVMTKSRRWDVR